MNVPPSREGTVPFVGIFPDSGCYNTVPDPLLSLKYNRVHYLDQDQFS